MQNYYETILTKAKKDFTKDKESIVKTLLTDDYKQNIKSVAFKESYSKARESDIIVTYWLSDDGHKVLKHIYVKNNGLVVLDYFKKDKIKLIDLATITKAK